MCFDFIFKLKNLGSLEKLIERYNLIARDLNFNMSEVSQASNGTHSSRLMAHAKVIWRTVGPIICESPHNKMAGQEHKKKQDFILEGGSSVTALKFALYVLTNDPKILYAPNGTEADNVISKVGCENVIFPFLPSLTRPSVPRKSKDVYT